MKYAIIVLLLAGCSTYTRDAPSPATTKLYCEGLWAQWDAATHAERRNHDPAVDYDYILDNLEEALDSRGCR